VWLSRVDQADPGALPALRALARAASGRDPVESRHAPVDVLDGALARGFGPDALHGRRVLLLAGIARPEGYRRTLAAMGAAVAVERLFPDHHRFRAAELAEALRAAEASRCELVVTTEKDAVRLPAEVAADPRVRAVRIEAQIVRGEESLEAALDAALASFAAAGTATATPTATPTRRAGRP
jgi:tetraacyldisaccharide 4'-kinase